MTVLNLLKNIEKIKYDYNNNKWGKSPHFDITKLYNFENWFDKRLKTLVTLSISKNVITGRQLASEIDNPIVKAELAKEVVEGNWVYSLVGHTGDFIILYYNSLTKAIEFAREDKENEFFTDVIVISNGDLVVYLNNDGEWYPSDIYNRRYSLQYRHS